MSALALLIVYFLSGFLARRLPLFPTDTGFRLNRLIIRIFLPALVLLYLPHLKFEKTEILPALMPWMSFILGMIFFGALGRFLQFPKATTRCLMLVGSMGNTSFIGFPLIEIFFGKAGLTPGIVIDQGGSFLVMSTLGILIVRTGGAEKVSLKEIIRKIIIFPPFIAVVLALATWRFAHPGWLDQILSVCGTLLPPAALFSVGFGFRPGHLGKRFKPLVLGLSFKMVLLPLIMMIFYGIILGMKGLNAQITVFEAAMPPMITAGILAAEENLDPELASLMVGVGIVLTLITAPLWAWAIKELTTSF